MNIAICDDEAPARENIVTCLENYMIERRVDVSYELFDHYKKLKDRIDDFDVFIMDYQMPDVDGLDFAHIIREKYSDTKTIIFVTSFSDIVYDAFSVRAHRFLVKPVDEKKFFEAMDNCIDSQGREKYITVKSDGMTNIINSDDIYYIEVQKKECIIRLESDSLVVHRAIADFEKELEGYGFFRAHRSFLINIRKIKCFNNRSLEFRNGEKIEISSRKYPDLCKEYLKMK